MNAWALRECGMLCVHEYGVFFSVCDVLTDKLAPQCENCAVSAFKGNCDCPEVQRGIDEYAREVAGRHRLDGGLFGMLMGLSRFM